MNPVVSFKTRNVDALHVLWCDVCDTLHEDEGPGAAGRVRRRAIAHVLETGHEVRVDTTHQRGWRLRPEVVEAIAKNGGGGR